MHRRVYISADYALDSGDRNVVDELNKWGTDSLHKVDFTDMAKVVSGSVAENPDCRPCDLKEEFNQQINLASIVLCVIGDKTSIRTAGSKCERVNKKMVECSCTPYKQNVNGSMSCKIQQVYTPEPDEDVGCINSYSYLRHEFEQAKRKGKEIIVLYNSMRKESLWLPKYMQEYEYSARPFWTKNLFGKKVGDYTYIKKALKFE